MGKVIEENKEIKVEDYIGHRKRVQEKYRKNGYSSLADYEVVEFILFSLIPRKDTKPIAKELLRKYQNIKGIFEADINSLKEVKGLGEASTTYLKFLGDMYSYYYEEKILKGNEKEIYSIKSKNQLINYLRANIGNAKDEEFKVLFLNSSNEVIQMETLFEGTLDRSAIYPRKILEKVLEYNARSIVLVHNHPSGNTLPSPKDIEVTKIMADFFKVVDVNVIDHIIIGRDSYFSFLEEGRL